MEDGQGTSGIDSDQEQAALSRTVNGGSALGDAQRDGVDAIALEQTALKWGEEDGPSAMSTAYKEFLEATSTALGRHITTILNLIQASRASMAGYAATEEDIVKTLRGLRLPSAGAVGTIQGAPTAAANAVPPASGSAGDDGSASASGGGFDARGSGAS